MTQNKTKKEKKNKNCRITLDSGINNSINSENKKISESYKMKLESRIRGQGERITSQTKKIKPKQKTLHVSSKSAAKKEHTGDSKTSESQLKSTENESPANDSEKTIRYNPEDLVKTVFVGNIASQTKKVQIIRLFSWAGNVVSVRFRTSYGTRITGKYLGNTMNAYIVLEDESAAFKALELNGTSFNGLHLRVNPAKKSEIENVKNTIFIGNLTYRANDEQLREIFSSCGEVEYVRTVQTEKGCRGIAYVCFKNPEAVGLALELNETLVDERPIHVERYNQQKKNDLQKKRPEIMESKSNHQFKHFRKFEKTVKTQNKNSHSKTNSNTEIKKKSNFRGIKTTIKKKSKKHNKGQMQWLIEKIAPKRASK